MRAEGKEGKEEGRKGGYKSIKNYGKKSRMKRGRNVHSEQSS
jgi:hypothetical protein